MSTETRWLSGQERTAWLQLSAVLELLQTNATLSRLSHVVSRLAVGGLVERFPCPRDARATNIQLTATGSARAREAAPGHVSAVREHVLDALTPDQLGQLITISAALLTRLNPLTATTTLTDGEEANEATVPTHRFPGPVQAPPRQNSGHDGRRLTAC